MAIIKHLVISGGGITGFSFYGALKESEKMGKWNMENIESIYGTSVGSLLAVILALKYDWETIDDYFIKRPWHNLYKFNAYSIIEGIHRRGIFTKQVIEDTLSPLLSARDIPLTVTMRELYDRTNMELHIFMTEIHSFSLINLSYMSHPDMKIVDAVYCSCAVPLLFSPLIDVHDPTKCYCDGGMIANYPILQCIEDGKDPNEIMGLVRIHDPNNEILITEESTLIDYAQLILRKSIEKIMERPAKKTKIHTEYVITSTPLSFYNITNVASSMDERIKLIELGRQYVIDFYREEEEEDKN